MRHRPNCQLVNYIAAQTGVPKEDITNVLMVATQRLSAELVEGKAVSLWGFGRFKIRVRKGRVDPFTRIYRPDSRYVKFNISCWLRKKLNPHQNIRFKFMEKKEKQNQTA